MTEYERLKEDLRKARVEIAARNTAIDAIKMLQQEAILDLICHHEAEIASLQGDIDRLMKKQAEFLKTALHSS
jgi:ADP-dependent phosphofructokinase/glucokinase